VLSVRLCLLEESGLKLLDLFRDVDSTLTVRRGLPNEKAAEVERLVRELQLVISQMKSELGLEPAEVNAAQQAGALVAAMTVNMHPDYLKGYGHVPQGLAMYIERRIEIFFRLMEEIRQTLAQPIRRVRPEG
jgi:ATP phosphoribosyltransferase